MPPCEHHFQSNKGLLTEHRPIFCSDFCSKIKNKLLARPVLSRYYVEIF